MLPIPQYPTIGDPNIGTTLWESCTMIEYLLSTYDKDYKLHFSTAPEIYLAQQCLHHQSSGQGPYFGQAMWFTLFHHDHLPFARQRYINEIKRVTPRFGFRVR